MSFFGGRRGNPQQPESQSNPSEEVQHTPPAPVQTPAPRPTAPPQPIGFETVLGASSVLEGTLTSSANVRLDGKFSGKLEIRGNVLAGETADIHADITAKNISIAGAVHGNVNGKKVQLLRTSRVWGDITAVALSTEEGAFIDGKITMGARDADKPATEPVAHEPEPEIMMEIEPEPDFLSGSDAVEAGEDTDDDAADSFHDEHPLAQ